MNNAELARIIGTLQSETQTLRSDLKDLTRAVEDLKEVMNQSKGAWKMLLVLASVFTALGAGAANVISWMGWTPR